jgi:Ion channel
MRQCDMYKSPSSHRRRTSPRFGREDRPTPDVSVPRVHFLSHWAVYSDRGSNVAVYFLVLVYLAIVGLAALYISIAAIDPSAFSSSVHTFSLTWLYFSLTTISTIGFGDVHAHSVGAQLAVMAQVAAGPLLLSWLVAVLLSPGKSSAARGHQGRLRRFSLNSAPLALGRHRSEESGCCCFPCDAPRRPPDHSGASMARRRWRSSRGPVPIPGAGLGPPADV